MVARPLSLAVLVEYNELDWVNSNSSQRVKSGLDGVNETF